MVPIAHVVSIRLKVVVKCSKETCLQAVVLLLLGTVKDDKTGEPKRDGTKEGPSGKTQSQSHLHQGGEESLIVENR